MLKNLFFAAFGLGMTLVEDVDDYLTKVVGDLIIIDPICELD